MRTPSVRSLPVRTFWLIVAAAGCGGDTATPDMGPPPAEMPVCTASMPSTSMPSTNVSGLSGASTPDLPPALAASGACAENTTAIVRALAGDIVPAGYTALGAAIDFTGASGPFPHGVDFVVPADLSLGPPSAPTSRIVVVEKRGSGEVVVVPVSNIVYESAWHRLHFHNRELGTYQAAIPDDAGKKITRHFTWRALSGASMGGFGGSHNFWRHPERYDAISVMGADPGPDFVYDLGFLHDYFFGGFCTADDQAAGRGNIGQLCDPARKPLTDQYENLFTFEHLYTQQGEGIGLTLKRSLYVRAMRDLVRTLGNPAFPSVAGAYGTYLPPGVPAEYLARSNADACDPAQAIVLHDFYDYRYNPAGASPVITFCDGGESAPGVFDGTKPQQDPTQVALAVDLNGNGVRDSGEPVVTQGSERFYDFGTDGLPDAMEPGYDPATNPDPNHDDYDYLENPTGTENNWRYDAGEKYDDFGTDGVQGKGCPIGTAPPSGVAGCYDYGEGNGQFDYTPNVKNWLAHDPHTLAEKLDDAMLDRLDVYYDAGIRDFLNTQVATNSLMAVLQARAQHVRIWDGFPALVGRAPSQETLADVSALDFTDYGRHMYVRYGDPDASEAQVEEIGDGRHVGSALQAAHRAQAMFYFLSRVWPGGDTNVDVGDSGSSIDDMFTATNGRVTPYSVVLPPGYDDAASANIRYPVVYLGHGYGMDPSGMKAVAVIANSAMVNDHVPAARRMQKMIIVLIDAKCRPGGDVSSGPLSPDGDECEEGGFYSNHPDGTYQGEDELLELQDIIDGKYRTKTPADVDVVQ